MPVPYRLEPFLLSFPDLLSRPLRDSALLNSGSLDFLRSFTTLRSLPERRSFLSIRSFPLNEIDRTPLLGGMRFRVKITSKNACLIDGLEFVPILHPVRDRCQLIIWKSGDPHFNYRKKGKEQPLLLQPSEVPDTRPIIDRIG